MKSESYKYSGALLRPFETVEPVELARLQRARKSTGAKLAALLPTWLKAHVRASVMPQRAQFDSRVIVPNLATPSLDPRGAYWFPGGQIAKQRERRNGGDIGDAREVRMNDEQRSLMVACESTAAYVLAFCTLNNLTQ